MNALTSHWQQDLSNKAIAARSISASVLIISDNPGLVRAVSSVCDYLDIAADRLTTEVNAAIAMRARRPLAVIVDAEGRSQDGFNVMKEVAAFDRDLPVMVLTHGDHVLAGAAEAVEEAWGLRSVFKPARQVDITEIVNFLAQAGRRSGTLALLPV